MPGSRKSPRSLPAGFYTQAMADKRPPGTLGLDLRSRSPRPCGLCGDIRQMSRAHVPPQAAGNSARVTSAVVRISDGVRRNALRGRGLWLRGLCEQCNNFAGARYDAAYGDFARRLRAYGWAAQRLRLVDPQAAPAVSVAPGLVARSVMIGMFAISPHLRGLFPQLATDLHECKASVSMPEGLELRLALYPYSTARLTGPVHSQRVLGRREHYNTFAEVYFPRLPGFSCPGGWMGRSVVSNRSLIGKDGRSPTNGSGIARMSHLWISVTSVGVFRWSDIHLSTPRSGSRCSATR